MEIKNLTRNDDKGMVQLELTASEVKFINNVLQRAEWNNDPLTDDQRDFIVHFEILKDLLYFGEFRLHEINADKDVSLDYMVETFKAAGCVRSADNYRLEYEGVVVADINYATCVVSIRYDYVHQMYDKLDATISESFQLSNDHTLYKLSCTKLHEYVRMLTEYADKYTHAKELINNQLDSETSYKYHGWDTQAT